MNERKIIYIDIDAFYASTEQRDRPELRGKSLVVRHAEEQGVVAATSHGARRYGVRPAVPSQKARRLCLQLVFVPGRMDIYKSVSHRVYEIFRKCADLIEPLSLSEASLDATEDKQEALLVVGIVRAIKQRIREELNLVTSAGVSYNKFLAKITSDPRKPDGLCTIHPDRALDLITRPPIESFWGIGPVTARKMYLLGTHNGLQLRGCSPEMLVWQLGKMGLFYYDFAREIDLRPVETAWICESIGCEHTLEKDIHVKSAMIIELYHVATELVEWSQQKDFREKALTLKIRFHDFSQITRSMTQAQELTNLEGILPLARQLLKEVEYEQRPIRSIGPSVSSPREETDEHRGVWE